MRLLEGRLFGLFAVTKRLIDVPLSLPLSQTSSSQIPSHTLYGAAAGILPPIVLCLSVSGGFPRQV